MEKLILFNKRGYDPFIDFLKTYCILLVVFYHGFHCMSEAGISIRQSLMPLFFLIQIFHCYKRDPKPINWKVIWNRIFGPFLAIEIFILALIYLFNKESFNLLEIIKQGGYGQGSYYPWVYLQMSILIPLLRPICVKFNKGESFLFFLLISETIEILCSFIHLPEYIYRLLCLRFIMLIWFGWMWVYEGIKINAITVLLSLFGLFSYYLLLYYKEGLEPWFYSAGFLTQKWPCYFWVSILLVYILYAIYSITVKSERIMYIVKILSSASYEIFLVQMAYYAVIKERFFAFLGSHYLQYGIWFLSAFVVSISCGVLLYLFENRYLMKKT